MALAKPARKATAMPEPPEIVPGKQIELYRHDGPSFRSIRVTLHDNGDVGLDLQDMGPLVEEVFGDADYERWTIVPAREVPRLAVALLIERYAGNAVAVDDFADFCAANGVGAERGSF
jgi:hypothetical protein